VLLSIRLEITSAKVVVMVLAIMIGIFVAFYLIDFGNSEFMKKRIDVKLCMVFLESKQNALFEEHDKALRPQHEKMERYFQMEKATIQFFYSG
jgi:hypothetical protein